MTPEQRARIKIDKLLEVCGWVVQDKAQLNLAANLGVAVREWPLECGQVDYLLFVDRKPVGVLEAKKEGTTLSGAAEQATMYLRSKPKGMPSLTAPMRFHYESTGTETYFRDIKDPESRSRRVFAFHQPETLLDWFGKPETLRGRLQKLPPLNKDGLRECQIEAVENLEESFGADKPRALLQMTMGSGKTYTAVSFIYRLIKFAGAKRILFLVDRRTLGRQAFTEFDQYRTPDDGRKFTELYNIQHLKSNTLDSESQVCITTIQRLYSMLCDEPELEVEKEEKPLVEIVNEDAQPFTVSYNPKIPIETFDFIVTDECHRSIYNLWRQVLEYFDASLIGLTATPSMQTIGFFNSNLVTEYSHERAVADGVNVGYEVYRIRTKATEKGGQVEAGFYVDVRDRQTRKVRWQKLDQVLKYEASQLDRSVVVPSQIRKVIQTFKDKLFTEIFPNRTEVPKTLIFAKDDSHAEDIVHIVREVFGKGNDFCKKITYRTTGESPETMISDFRNSYNPRIVVTVDMISTGTDMKPLECLLFMRDVKSSVYFEQMKGRGTRVVNDTEFNAVTNDAPSKTHFVIVDAVGVCEGDKTDSRPLERKRGVKFESLLESIQFGFRDEDTLSSLANRLARLDRKLKDEAKKEIEKVSGGVSLRTLINNLLQASDADAQETKAAEMFGTETPDEEQVKQAAAKLAEAACAPFDNPDLRETIKRLKQQTEQIIDTVTQDELLGAGFDEAAKERARSTIETFRKFIAENRDELTALQIFYSQPYGKRQLTEVAIRELAEAIARPPYNLAPQQVWAAYEQLEKAKVRGAGTQKLLTNLVSLLLFELGETPFLESWDVTVEARFDRWLKQQESAGREFAPEQLAWLQMIRDHIANALTIEIEDFDNVPFNAKGGAFKVYLLFGEELENILNELNGALAA